MFVFVDRSPFRYDILKVTLPSVAAFVGRQAVEYRLVADFCRSTSSEV
jgi:hypothetical protein